MTTNGRHIHEAGLYASDDELLSIVVPFLRGGRDAGEPTLAVLPGPTLNGVLDLLGDTAGVAFLGASGRRANPAQTVRNTSDLVASGIANGAEQIRLVATIPHERAGGAQWDWWARFENAVNRIYAPYPLWNICLYDLRTVSGPVLDDVLRTHPRITTGDGNAPNPRYEEPDRFLHTRSAAPPDPVQLTAPLVDLTDPSAAGARRAARAVGSAAGLPPDGEHDLVTAISETVSNGLAYGVRPVRLRIWVAPDHVLATVDDAGPGPCDPLAGLVPTSDTVSGGMGLWLTHRVCSHVVHSRTATGFTIRMAVDLPEVG